MYRCLYYRMNMYAYFMFPIKGSYFSVLYSIEKYGTFKRNFVGALHCTTTTAASKNV